MCLRTARRDPTCGVNAHMLHTKRFATAFSRATLQLLVAACSLAKRVRVRDAILESLVLILLVCMRCSPRED